MGVIMKKIIILTFILSLSFNCLGQTETSDESNKPRVYILQQVPFSENLEQLSALDKEELDKILNNYLDYEPKSLDKIAFKLGSDIADALVCLKAKNSVKLREIVKNLPHYGEVLGISEEFLRLSVSLSPLIKEEKWDGIKEKLEEYHQKILKELYNMNSLDHIVLVQLGGWIKGIADISYVLKEPENYSREKTKIFYNKNMILALGHDIANIHEESEIPKPYIVKAKTNLKRMKVIIYSAINETYSLTDIKDLNKLANEIIIEFAL